MRYATQVNILHRLIAGDYIDPATGKAIALPLKAAVISDDLRGSEADHLHALDLGHSFALVCDANTYAALGQRIEHALGDRAPLLLLPGTPKADIATVEHIRAASAHCDALVAVGGGTINDLCKYAAHLDGKPYAVFGTTPSMNGYASANAAIMVKRHKKSLPAQMPAGIFLDLGVLCAAPARLIRSGLGDSLCRPTAQADWLLSHLLFDTPYSDTPFLLLRDDEDALLENTAGLLKGDRDTMRCLARTLLLSGIGMVIAGGSYPASQGEHLLAHYIEMLHPAVSTHSYHGEQIGVTTLVMSELQKRMLSQMPTLHHREIDTQNIIDHFGSEIGAHCIEEMQKKWLSREAVDSLNARIMRDWENFAQQIDKVTRPTAALSAALKAIGAPYNHSDLQWPDAIYQRSRTHAHCIRDRFTFLDLEWWAAGSARKN
ncbi:MAG: iron-containing alcohol dehydrogenase [Alphaproteobacteria bacterium]|nr:iron-containing alcohol dehydrogenase [Alphaproteobacteria bacterium]